MGVTLGQKDMHIKKQEKYLKIKLLVLLVIILLIKQRGIKNKADYIALGALI